MPVLPVCSGRSCSFGETPKFFSVCFQCSVARADDGSGDCGIFCSLWHINSFRKECCSSETMRPQLIFRKASVTDGAGSRAFGTTGSQRGHVSAQFR